MSSVFAFQDLYNNTQISLIDNKIKRLFDGKGCVQFEIQFLFNRNSKIQHKHYFVFLNTALAAQMALCFNFQYH